MLPHEAAALAVAGVAINTGNAAAGSGGGGGVVGIAKSAADVNATASTTSSPSVSATTTTTTSSSSPLTTFGFGSGSGSGSGSSSSSGSLDCIPVLKLIEETLQYLTKVINYAPEESIACLRQLLKYLFARNYGNRQQYQHQHQHQQQQQHHKHQMKQGHYPAFIKSYFKAKCREKQCFNNQDDGLSPGSARDLRAEVVADTTQQHVPSYASATPSSSQPYHAGRMTSANVTSTTSVQLQALKRVPFMDAASTVGFDCGTGSGGTGGTLGLQADYLLLSELFESALEYHSWKSPYEAELARHIKLFEPLVIYCLTVSCWAWESL